MGPKRLYRNRKRAMISGVCQGIADYFQVDPTIIRLAWVAAFFFWGSGILAYLIAWLIMPERPNDLD